MGWRITVLIAVLILMLAGCQKPDANVTELVAQIKPIVEKGLTEAATRTATAQGGLQGIEPGYGGTIDAFWVTGVKATWTVYLKGVAGQVTGSLQGDNDATPKPK